MKKIFLFALVYLASNVSAQNVVHFCLHSHNEIQDYQKGINYAVAAQYGSVTATALRIKDTVIKYSVKWNLQVESNLILGCLLHESANTNPTDFLQSMDSHSLIEVDPHNHINLASGLNYNPNNYADVAHLLDSCGLTPARVNVGGFLYKAADWTYPLNGDDWTTWKTGLKGNAYPSYTWTPTTLWGGGTPGHVDDYNAFGMWRPAGTTSVSFGNNNAANLIAIGNGCEKWAIEDTTNVTALFSYISAYVNYCNAAPTLTNTFYTASATMNFRGFLSSTIVDSVSKFIRKMNTLKTSGKIVWENMSETKANWIAAHPNANDNFVVRCKSIALGIEQYELEKNGFAFYPNPASDFINVIKVNSAERVKIFDLNGKLIIDELFKGDEVKLNIAKLAPGIYILNCGQGSLKFVKE